MLNVAYLGITSRCNFSCKHCYLLPNQKNLDIPYEKAKALLQELYDVGVLKIIYTHGEVFLHKNWKDILLEAHEMGFAQNVLTNGYLLDKEKSIALEKAKIQKFFLSLDSSNPQIHSQNRNNPKAWDGLKRGVKLLQEYTTAKIGLNVVLSPWVEDELLEMLDIAEDWGVDELNFLPYHAKENDKKAYKAQTLSEKLINLIKYSKDKKCLISLHDPYLSSLLRLKGHILGRDVCGAGKDYISIHADGDVFPCNFLPILLGNIFTDSIQQIATKAENFRKIAELSLQSACRQCPIYSTCQGGCMAFAFKNKKITHDINCTQNKGVIDDK